MPDSSHDFIDHLREEKLKAQESRSHLTVQKLAFATALLGLSFVEAKAGPINASLLFFLVPWVAIVFDFYIMGEDYSVKRIGGFLCANTTDYLEQKWEETMPKMRDPFAPWAMPILTTLLLIGSLIIGLQNVATAGIPLWVVIVWAAAALIISWGLFFAYRRLRAQVSKVFGAPVKKHQPGSIPQK